MKAFTSIEQSKKLAEILPLETADMHLMNSSIKGEIYVDEFKPVLVPYLRAKDSLDAYSKIVNNMIAWEVIPCWSLAALLEEIPSIIVNNVGEDLKLHINKDNLQYSLFYENEYTGDIFEIETELYDDMIDACYEMISKLHELNLL